MDLNIDMNILKYYKLCKLGNNNFPVVNSLGKKFTVVFTEKQVEMFYDKKIITNEHYEDEIYYTMPDFNKH